MKRRATTGGKVGKARRRKIQISRAARVVARRGSSDASLREQIDQSRRERDEALEQQAATSEVLNVIRNSPSNTQPVFDAIVRRGLKLFANAAITIALPQGGQVVAGAIADADPKRAEALRRRLPIPLRREFMHSLAIIDGKIVDVPDVDNPPAHLASGAKNFRASGFRAVTIVPMMQSGTAIGALSVARVAPGPLSDKQNAILQIFAAQAVIAIENTRLLNELRKSLQQQTATAEVLKVISRSTFDLPTVLNTLSERLHALPPHSGVAQRKGGYRTGLAVPLLREGQPIGIIFLFRSTVKAFTDNQIDLATTFAAQAVIAIENTRLLNELRQRTDDLGEALEQQTATSEVLKVISGSLGNLQPVFDAMLANATHLCGAKFASLVLWEGDHYRRVSLHNAPPAFAEYWWGTRKYRPHP